MMVDWGCNNMAGVSVVDWSGDNVMGGNGDVMRSSDVVSIRDGSWGVCVSVHCWPARILGDWSMVDWSMCPCGVGPDS